MNNLNILFLEPKAYYEELGFLDILKNIGYRAKYGVYNLSSLKKNLKEYDLIVTCIYHSGLSIAVSTMAREENIPTVYVIDGILQWENMFNNPLLEKKNLSQLFPIYSDIVFCTCISEKRFIESFGCKGIIYMPKRIYSNDTSDSTQVDYSKELDFLISTANMAYFDKEEKNRLIVLIKETVLCLKEHGYSWACRIFDNDILKAIKEIDPDANNDTESDFNVTSKKYKCLLTSPSSIAIPFFIDEKPVGFFDYRDGPLFLQAGWRINATMPIKETLSRMLLRENEERIIFQKTQLASLKEDGGFLFEANHALQELLDYNELATFKQSKEGGRKQGGWSFEFFLRLVYKCLKKNRYTKKFVADKAKSVFARGKK